MKLERRYIVASIILIILIIGSLFFIYFNSLNNRPILLEKSQLLPTPEASNTPEVKKPLFQPPEVVKSIYVTSWSATKESYIDYIINLAQTTEINSVVIDIKDWSGYVAYDANVPDVETYGAKSIRIKNISSLIQRFHEKGIYVIARIAVFQDPRLAQARPDLAIHSESKLAFSAFSPSTLWLDKSGLAWIDPAAKTAWKYNTAIAKDALSQGFNEINFDYVRFPSDGDLKDMVFSLWDASTTKHLVIKDFFKYLRQELGDAKLSIDLFGLATVNFDDLGVGQIIEDAFEYFDYVSPMIYPSHYAPGFLGYQNPAEYPYEVVKYSMGRALERLSTFKQTQKSNVQLRPWLQDFDLGAVYDAQMIRSEIRAVYDSAGNNFKGFMLWNSSNVYTEEALQPTFSR